MRESDVRQEANTKERSDSNKNNKGKTSRRCDDGDFG